jgi:uncharacterized Fe-S cluster-containing radical SAM superfamily protein
MPDSMPLDAPPVVRPLDPAKFQDPAVTADGSVRATVALKGLETLWFNTGTLCNVACVNCYIESSPSNDRLEYLTLADVKAKLDEARDEAPGLAEIGFTGGEPFMNPDIIPMLTMALDRGYQVLMLTNAMRPMQRSEKALDALNTAYPGQLTMRVSLDHYTAEMHEKERGPGSWAPAMRGLKFLADKGFRIDIAGRLCWGEHEIAARSGFAELFKNLPLDIDADDPSRLVLFPEMDEAQDIAEITDACWGILDKSPDAVMCASSRMVVRRKGAAAAGVLACTLIPYDAEFELGETLAEASKPVALNHPHCARFCVLGGASCSG